MSEKDFFSRFVYDSEKDMLGSGGFGTVYKAYDQVEKRYVAIKISQVKDIYGKFTLFNEVELSKTIDDHANVARYEFGLRVKQPFLVDYGVMAYYEEGNLDMVLRKKHGILSEQEVYEIVSGLLEGIEHLHTEKVIHRDLKLANILMHRTKRGQWRPKIADFGLSRQMQDFDMSINNSAIGLTIPYSAPEQIGNKPIRSNVDLWAFAVIVYRILTGEMPFYAPVAEGADATAATLEMSRKIINLELPDKLHTLPEPYQTIVKRCFVKDTKDRAQSAAELLEILRASKKAPLFATENTTQADTPSSSKKLKEVEPDTIIDTNKKDKDPDKTAIIKKDNDATSIMRSSPIPKLRAPSVSEDKNTVFPTVDTDKTKIFSPQDQPSQPNTRKRKLLIGLGGLLLCCSVGLGIYKFNQTASETPTVSQPPTQTELTQTQALAPKNDAPQETTQPTTSPTQNNEVVSKKPANTPNNTKNTPITGNNPPPSNPTPSNPTPSQPTPAPPQPEPVVPNKEVKKEPTHIPKTDPIVDKKIETPPQAPNQTNRPKPNNPQPPINNSSPAPELVNGLPDFMAKVSCKGCCKDLKSGTLTIINFTVETNGKVSFTEKTNVTIVNNGVTLYERLECRIAILEVFKKHYKWKSPKNGSYLYGRYDISY